MKTASTSGGLNSATWVGPDGTNSSYFDTSPTIIGVDPSASGTQYIQFKIYITTDGVTSSSVESITVNYTP